MMKKLLEHFLDYLCEHPERHGFNIVLCVLVGCAIPACIAILISLIIRAIM